MLDFCYDVKVEHPGQIEIVENGVVKEIVSAITSPYWMTYGAGIVDIDGKKCITQVPIVKIESLYSDYDGKPTNRENAYFVTTKTYGVDGQMMSISDDFGETGRNKQEK